MYWLNSEKDLCTSSNQLIECIHGILRKDMLRGKRRSNVHRVRAGGMIGRKIIIPIHIIFFCIFQEEGNYALVDE